jgi:hypothetical protein
MSFLQSLCDFTGFVEGSGARSIMTKTKPARRQQLQPLETGQIWQMPEANLQVGMVGKLLVHYKLGKPNAIRVANSCNGIKTIEKYLKANKAVLVSA